MEQKLRHTMSSIPTTFGTTLQVFEHESKKLAKIGQIPGPADYLSPQTFLDSGKKITIPKVFYFILFVSFKPFQFLVWEKTGCKTKHAWTKSIQGCEDFKL
jgi:hypothetical protein